MLQPVVVAGGQTGTFQGRELIQRKVLHALWGVVQHVHQLLAVFQSAWDGLAKGREVSQGEVSDPCSDEVVLEGPTLVGPAIVVLRGGEVGGHGNQVWGCLHGSQPLRGAGI